MTKKDDTTKKNPFAPFCTLRHTSHTLFMVRLILALTLPLTGLHAYKKVYALDASHPIKGLEVNRGFPCDLIIRATKPGQKPTLTLHGADEDSEALAQCNVTQQDGCLSISFWKEQSRFNCSININFFNNQYHIKCGNGYGNSVNITLHKKPILILTVSAPLQRITLGHHVHAIVEHNVYGHTNIPTLDILLTDLSTLHIQGILHVPHIIINAKHNASVKLDEVITQKLEIDLTQRSQGHVHKLLTDRLHISLTRTSTWKSHSIEALYCDFAAQHKSTLDILNLLTRDLIATLTHRSLLSIQHGVAHNRHIVTKHGAQANLQGLAKHGASLTS